MTAHARIPAAAMRARMAELDAEVTRLQAIVDRHDVLFRDSSILTAIVVATCERFEIRRADLLGQTRHVPTRRARQVAMYLAREMTPMSLALIGQYVGHRDHSTVVHAVRRIDGWLEDAHPISADVEAIRERVMSRTGRAG